MNMDVKKGYPNVLRDFAFGWRYYLTHPHKWIKEIIINIKNGWQRATRGYCDSDWFNMDHWMTTVWPKMFRAMAKEGMAYPGAEPFETEEKWHDWLLHVANELEKCTEEYCDSQNEYYDAFLNQSFKDDKRDKIIDKNYMKRAEELQTEAQKRIIKIMSEIGENFYSLWD